MSTSSTDSPPSCDCDKCQNACRNKPGWFSPGEAEKAAELKGLTLQSFFDQFLAVDWWEADGTFDKDVFVLAPAVKGNSPGEEYPGNPAGECVFYDRKTGHCGIHAAKPAECRWYHHDKGEGESVANHGVTPIAWNTPEHQAQIRALLGREPRTESYSIFDL